LNKLVEIEQNYPVDKIRVNGIKIWPWLRTYIGSQILFSGLGLSENKRFNLIKLVTSFFYGYKLPKQLEYVIFSVASQRKKIHNHFTDRMDVIVELNPKTHIFESPLPYHHKKNQLPHKNISSKMPFIFREQIQSRTLKINIQGEEIIEKILSEHQISIPYINLCRRFITQTQIMEKLIKKHPIKALFLITPYTNMGYVYAAKTHNIPVIEIQHGVINKQHYAYNVSKTVNSNMYPDFLLTWGSYIGDVFKENDYINEEKVIPVGNYFIDTARESFSLNTKLSHAIKKYKYSIGFTAQSIYESDTIPLICEAARKNKNIAIVYISRDKKQADYAQYQLPENVIFADHLNFYEIIQHCNFHSTISSSCAIEAPALGISNLLFNYNNRAEAYYKNILPTSTKYFDNFNDLISYATTASVIEKNRIIAEHSYLAKPDFRSNVKHFISDNQL
jgi:hypothetical protein